ncbi:MAG: DUF5916 domain-containing protein [Bacteroidota bacterium]|nr:hypothetical protein [Odoribacter sp.]MDP3645321.1 DUF5916 domain-containing protein [Bacteroidota bacterium]
MLLRLFFFLIILLIGLSSAVAQPEKYSLSSDSTVNRLAGAHKVYYATRIEKRPKIDGKLNDVCWETGIWSGGFIQQVPNQGKKPSQDTEIKLLYDNSNLYVAFKCYDKGPGKIRPILSRRDKLAGDIAGIALDSYLDKQTAYEFNVAASGQKVDLVHLGAYLWDFNWDAVWDGKAQVYDSIWTSEIQIPFSQIRFAPGKEQVWGMHVWRWIDRLNEEDQWKLIPIDAPSMVYLFGELRGIEGIKPKVNYEFLPYLDARFNPNTDLENKTTYGYGLNGKVGLNSGFTLDYAINPDFGQVEADPAVLNLTSYEIFNEEKRPFFLEGNTILDFSFGEDMLYYSRRIGHAPSYLPSLDDNQTMNISENTPILSALKLTGKTKNGLSVGVVQSITAKENAIIYSNDSKSKMAVEPFTSFMVGRIKQDFNKGNTVLGGMVTSTYRNINDTHLEFLSNSSLAGGIDFQHNWKKRKYYIDFKGFFTEIKGDEKSISKLQYSPVHNYQRIDAGHLEYDTLKTSLSGWGGSLQGGKRSGKLRIIGSLNWRTPGVDLNDVGYLAQADVIKQMVNITYKVSQPKGIIQSYFVEFEQEHVWNYGKETTLDRFKIHGYTQFKNLWNIHLNLKGYINYFDTRELSGNPNIFLGPKLLFSGPKLFKDDCFRDVELFVQTNQAKDLFIGFGPRLRYIEDQISKTSYFTTFIRWQISDRFSISSRTVFDHSIDNHEYIRNTKYLVGKIDRNTISSTFRLEYFVSPEISLQYYGNPYASIGKFDDFREVADADNKSLALRYNKLEKTLMPNNYYQLENDEPAKYLIRNPDFNYQKFNSNLVGRWEFKPGSTFYLVWTNTRFANSGVLDQSIWKSFINIPNVKSQNVFMVKFSYWFSL